MRRQQRTLLVTGMAVAAAVALMGLSWISGQAGNHAPIAADAAIGADRNVWGKPGARVRLVEYGDYL